MNSRVFTLVLSFAAMMAAARTATGDPSAASAARPGLHRRVLDPELPSVARTAEPREAVDVDEPYEAGAGHASSAGAFLPFSVGASTDATYGRAASGYDGARRTVVYEGVADAHVSGGLSVRAGYSSQDLSGRASALLGGRFQFLSQKRHGLDLTVGFFYLPQDIEGEGLVKGSLLLGRNLGRLALFGSVGYGQDPEGDDHHAELSMGFLLPLVPPVFVGVDARARALVFSSDAKHNGISEPVIDVAAGPLAHYVLGPIVLTSHVGLSALAIEGPHGSTRPTTEMRYGVLGLLSAGFAL